MNKWVEAAKKKAEEKSLTRNKARDEAQEFVNAFKEANGTKGYISLRIRDGYIGKELDKAGRKLQTERASPRGTLVAIKGAKEGEVFIGSVYKANKDEDIPIVGIMEALKDAINQREGKEANKLKPKDVDLLNFFTIRAKCFFWPEIYSYSRGINKLTYPNYDKIHANRKRVLGEEA